MPKHIINLTQLTDNRCVNQVLPTYRELPYRSVHHPLEPVLSGHAVQPGQWVECPQTQERGQIIPYSGRSLCIQLGDGITLYASAQSLEALGWRLMQPELRPD
ncbi:MAG: hypothetical protein AAFY78_21305 [Cyanobacteria bacterium J06648_16]